MTSCANPKYSRFDKYQDLTKQIDIPDSNLSRFDLVFALEDNIDEEKDTQLATNLLHKEKFVNDVDVIDTDLFKKYITYAKTECFPVLEESACKCLVEFYVDTRQTASRDGSAKPITTRDLMALERLTIAKAKTQLHDKATVDDAKHAIRIYKEALKTIGLTPETAGQKESIPSNDELSLIREGGSMINHLRSLGGMFENDIMIHVRREIGVMSRGMKNIDLDDLMEKIVEYADEHI